MKHPLARHRRAVTVTPGGRRAAARWTLAALAALGLGAPASAQENGLSGPLEQPDPTAASTVAAPAAAEEPSVEQLAGDGLTLLEALRLAEASAESVRLATAEVDRVAAQRRLVRSQALPQLNGAAGYNRTLASEFEDVSFDFGDGGDGGGFSDLPFGQRNTWRLGLAVSQNLWAGGRIAGRVQALTAQLRAAEEGLGAARAVVSLDVTQAYFDALLAERLVEISEATLAQSEEALRQTKLAFEVGNQSEFDLLRAQVARDNQRPELLQRHADRELAYLRLAQLVGLPAGSTPPLTTSFADFALWSGQGEAPPPRDAREAWVERVAEARTPVIQAQAGVAAREGLLRAARGERWPQVALGSDYGKVGYPASGLPSWGDLRTNWTVGVNLAVPLFTGGRVAAQIAEAEAGKDDAEARLDQVRELSRLDARDALERLATAEAVWEASGGTVEQAERAYQIAELRYREGLSTQLELSDARVLLRQAQANRALAARNLQIARARVALLPRLPLGAGSSATAAGASASAANSAPASAGANSAPGAF